MEQYPRFLASSEDKPIDDDADESNRDRQAAERLEPVVYANLFSAAEA